LTGVGGSSVSAANPTATASDTAVNGVAATFMRSDAAPAIQKGTNSVFGLAEGDGSTVSMTAGVVSAAGGPVMGLKANEWTVPLYAAATTTAGTTGAANTIYCSRQQWTTKATIGGMGTRITTSSAGSSSLAIYRDNISGPGALIAGLGTNLSTGSGVAVSANLTANKQIGLGGTDSGGLTAIWVCYNKDNAGSATLAANNNSAFGPVMMSTATLGNALSSTVPLSGKSCAGANCQGGSSTFSGTPYVWPADLTSSTWSDVVSAIPTVAAIQVISIP